LHPCGLQPVYSKVLGASNKPSKYGHKLPTSSYPLLLDQMDGIGYMNIAHCQHTCKGNHLLTRYYSESIIKIQG
jgi:hypothetical protein